VDHESQIEKLATAFQRTFNVALTPQAAKYILNTVSLETALSLLRKCDPEKIRSPIAYFKTICDAHAADNEIPWDKGKISFSFLSRSIFQRRYYAKWPEIDRWERIDPPEIDLEDGSDLGSFAEIYKEECQKLEENPDSWEPPRVLLKFFKRENLKALPLNSKKAILHGLFRAELEKIAK